MVKCYNCGGETGDDINYCLKCSDRDSAIRNKARSLESVKSLDNFGAVIDGKSDLKEAAKRFVRD